MSCSLHKLTFEEIKKRYGECAIEWFKFKEENKLLKDKIRRRNMQIKNLESEKTGLKEQLDKANKGIISMDFG